MTDLLDLKPTKAAPITSSVIKQGMLVTWAAPEYAIMWEVGDATGARHTRFADAVIMSLWPSRGLELHGVEIKVSRSDWKREATDPKKAETIAKYCDRWYVHTAPGVIQDIAEVPPMWGLREFDGKKWKTIREAERNPEPETVNRTFLAALLRRADGEQRRNTYEAAQAMITADREGFEKRIADEVEHRTKRNLVAIEQVEAFEAASGLKLSEFGFSQDAAEIGHLVKVIRASGLTRTYDGLVGARDAARTALEVMEAALAETGIPMPSTTLAARARRFT